MKDLPCSCWSSHFQSFRSSSPSSSEATATAARQPLRFLPTNPPFNPNSFSFSIHPSLSFFTLCFTIFPALALCIALGKRMCTVRTVHPVSDTPSGLASIYGVTHVSGASPHFHITMIWLIDNTTRLSCVNLLYVFLARVQWLQPRKSARVPACLLARWLRRLLSPLSQLHCILFAFASLLYLRFPFPNKCKD